jgi:3-oxoacyl-[acyl-carrier protein] reductase
MGANQVTTPSRAPNARWSAVTSLAPYSGFGSRGGERIPVEKVQQSRGAVAAAGAQHGVDSGVAPGGGEVARPGVVVTGEERAYVEHVPTDDHVQPPGPQQRAAAVELAGSTGPLGATTATRRGRSSMSRTRPTVRTPCPLPQRTADGQDEPMDLGLRDRVYIVTGGTRGLGFATAQALVADGARVVVSGRDGGRAEQAAIDLGGHDVALGLAADLSTGDGEGRLVAAATARYGRLDGALISVGGPPAGTVLGTTDEVWREAFESIFVGAVRTARTVAAELQEGGAMAFVLSSSVRTPIGNLAVSNGLRPGLAMVAKTLADELGSRGIRVNGLLPGRIETDRLKELDAASGRPVSQRREAEAAIPLGRYGEPAEFGRVAAFLLSPAASYLNGAMVPVDGGALRAL